MKNFLIREIMSPLTRRLGTALGAYLVGTLAVEPDTAEKIVIGFGALCMVAVDLFGSYMVRKGRH